jgi:hypothetical protein
MKKSYENIIVGLYVYGESIQIWFSQQMHKLWIRRANLNNLNIQGFWYPEPIPG